MMYSVTVDADRMAVLSAIDTAAAELGISWFLCGAYSRILLNDELEVKSAGYAEQFVLKLFAWRDRRSTNGIDDASDLAYFLCNAFGSISENDLYGKYDSVLQETEYDIELASHFVLGRQIRSVFSGRTIHRIIEILRGELQAGEDSALMADMYERFSSWSHPDERISTVIDQVLKGLSPDED